MKKPDDINRTSRLLSEEKSYGITVMLLSFWALYNCHQSITKDIELNPLPGIIALLAVLIQIFSQKGIKKGLEAEDEFYTEDDPRTSRFVKLAAALAAGLTLLTYLSVKIF